MQRTAGPSPKAKNFISCSRKNVIFTDRLEAALKTRGFEPLIGRTETMPPPIGESGLRANQARGHDRVRAVA